MSQPAQASMPQPLDDKEMRAWIDNLNETELREVLNYLVLLNADAVHNALSYVQRSAGYGHGASAHGRNDVENGSSPGEGLPNAVRSGDAESTNNANNANNARVSTSAANTEKATPQRRRPVAEDLVSPGPSGRRKRSQMEASTRRGESNHSRSKVSLLVLCTSKPSSKKQAQDQDKSMLICKQAGVLPDIILKEKQPQEAKHLLRVSLLTEFPQFFYKAKQDDAVTRFLGDFDTVHQLYIQDQFSYDALFNRLQAMQPPQLLPEFMDETKEQQQQQEQPESNGTQQKKPNRLDTLFRQTSQLRLSMKKTPLVEYEESSDDSTTMHSAMNGDSTNSKDVPAHLQGMNQPLKLENEETDETSLQSLGEIFDDPKPIVTEKPLLAAARKAAEQNKRQSDIDRGVPPHLAGMNDPNVVEADDNVSLGEDPQQIFDPPPPVTSDKPLLAAAKMAASQLSKEKPDNLPERAQTPDKLPAESIPPPSPPTATEAPTPIRRNIGFLQETVTLKSVSSPNARPIAGRIGEIRNNPADDQPPPSPSASKTRLSTVMSPGTSSPIKAPLTAPPESANGHTTPIPNGQVATQQHNGPSSAISPQAPQVQAAPAQQSPPTPTWMSVYEEKEQENVVSPTPPSSNVPAWMMNAKTATSTEPERGVERKKSQERKFPDRGCYLVYDAVESELNIYFSEVPIVGAVGVWSCPDMLAFQQAQGFGKSELIGNCADGVQDRQRYYEGWCQFVKAAKSMEATVTILEVGVPVDFYLYKEGTTIKAQNGEFETENVDAVACVPRNADFPVGLKGKKWSKAAKKIGAVALFRSLSSKDGAKAAANEYAMSEMGSLSQLHGAPPTIPEEEALTEDFITPSVATTNPFAPQVEPEEQMPTPTSEPAFTSELSPTPPVDNSNTNSPEPLQIVSAAATTPTPLPSEVVPTSTSDHPNILASEPLTAQSVAPVAAETTTTSPLATVPFTTPVRNVTPQVPASPEPSPARESELPVPPAPAVTVSAPPIVSQAPKPPASSLRAEVKENSTPLEKNGTSALSDAAPLARNDNGGFVSAMTAPNPEGGACYLVYEPDSSGRLVEHYSKTPVADAIGRWVPTGTKKIAGFKFKQNLGKSVLIGNCSAGVQGRRNYSSGWCQFIRSARVMQGEVMLWDPVGKGLMVDVYVYQNDNRPAHQSIKLQPGVSVNVEKILAVACIPKNTPFFEGMAVDILKWLADGANYGASSRF